MRANLGRDSLLRLSRRLGSQLPKSQAAVGPITPACVLFCNLGGRDLDIGVLLLRGRRKQLSGEQGKNGKEARHNEWMQRGPKFRAALGYPRGDLSLTRTLKL